MLRDRLLEVSLEQEERKLREYFFGLKLVLPEKQQVFQYYQGVAKKTLVEVKKLYDEAEGCLAFEAKKIPVVGQRYLHAAVFYRTAELEGQPCWEMFGYHPYYKWAGNVVVELFAKRLRDKKKIPIKARLEGRETQYTGNFKGAGFQEISKTENQIVLKIDRDWTPVTGFLKREFQWPSTNP